MNAVLIIKVTQSVRMFPIKRIRKICVLFSKKDTILIYIIFK